MAGRGSLGGSFCSNTSSSATSPTRELWPHAGHCRREVQLQSRETREKQSTTRVTLTHCRDMLNEGKRDVLHPLTQTFVHSGINLLGLDCFESRHNDTVRCIYDTNVLSCPESSDNFKKCISRSYPLPCSWYASIFMWQ